MRENGKKSSFSKHVLVHHHWKSGAQRRAHLRKKDNENDDEALQQTVMVVMKVTIKERMKTDARWRWHTFGGGGRRRRRRMVSLICVTFSGVKMPVVLTIATTTIYPHHYKLWKLVQSALLGGPKFAARRYSHVPRGSDAVKMTD